jgi:hypothetical protein
MYMETSFRRSSVNECVRFCTFDAYVPTYHHETILQIMRRGFRRRLPLPLKGWGWGEPVHHKVSKLRLESQHVKTRAHAVPVVLTVGKRTHLALTKFAYSALLAKLLRIITAEHWCGFTVVIPVKPKNRSMRLQIYSFK